MRLTESQISSFHENGYLLLEQVLDPEDLQPVIEEYSDIIDERAQRLHSEGKVSSLYAAEPFTRRLLCLAEEASEVAAGLDIMQARGEATFNFLKNPKILDVAESLVGSEILCTRIPEAKSIMMNIQEIQSYLTEQELDGWLLYDFRGLNAIAQNVAGLAGLNITRRWFCYIRTVGEPIWLVHQIEGAHFSDMTGDVRTYTSWRALDREMTELLPKGGRIAMEYSPNASIPYVSRVDAGTLEWIRGLDVEVVSSADLVQHIEARWTAEQFAGHQESARFILEAKDDAFAWMGDQLRRGNQITECPHFLHPQLSQPRESR